MKGSDAETGAENPGNLVELHNAIRSGDKESIAGLPVETVFITGKPPDVSLK